MPIIKKKSCTNQKTPLVGQLWPIPKLELSLVQGGCGDRGNARNKNIDSSETIKKYYKEEIEAFGAVLALKYEKVYLKKYSDVFREKLITYTMKQLKNAEDVLMLVQGMEYPKDSFDTKKEPNDLNEYEANYEVKKAIMAARVRHYIEREKILV